MKNQEYNDYRSPEVQVLELHLENYLSTNPDRADNDYEDNDLGEI